MTVDVKKLRDLAEAQMPNESRGKWYARETYVYQSSDPRDRRQVCRVPTVVRPHEVDPTAAFIAAANPQAIIALLDEIERLRGRVLKPLTEREVQRALHEGRAEAMAATGDNAWTSLLKQRDEAIRESEMKQQTIEKLIAMGIERDALKQQFAAMTAARDQMFEFAKAEHDEYGWGIPSDWDAIERLSKV